MSKIGLVGIGRLGLCFALNLERAGHEVYAVDTNEEHVQLIESKTLASNEPHVNQFLEKSVNLHASSDLKTILDQEIRIIFVCVPTPSNKEGTFDHSIIDQLCIDLLSSVRPEQEKHLIINSTVMPGYCENLHSKMSSYGYSVSYNPEFIAQGSIINDQLYPDQVLIGEANREAGDMIEAIYRSFVKNSPRYSRMTRTEAEVTKLAVNCFLTTKIAFANSIGDLTIRYGGNQDAVLGAIGADERIGSSFLKYGFGYGGPCLPRDNRAMERAADGVELKLPISLATDEANNLHREFQSREFEEKYTKGEQIVFTELSYKSNSDIIEESQRLHLAVDLANKGYTIILKDRSEVLDQIRAIHSDLFTYETIEQ